MNLRDNIEGIVHRARQEAHSIGYSKSGYGLRPYDSTEIADAILALPSGLVAVRECNHYAKGYADDLCLVCHGANLIYRDISIQELVEWEKESVLRAKEPRTLNGDIVEVKK